MCPVSSPVHVVFHTIAMRIKLMDSCKAFKIVPGSVPIIFNEFKDILLRTIQVRESTITQKEQKIKQKNILARRAGSKGTKGGGWVERMSHNQTKENSYLYGIANILSPVCFIHQIILELLKLVEKLYLHFICGTVSHKTYNSKSSY